MTKNQLKLIEQAASHIVNNAIIAQQDNEDTKEIAETELRDWFDKLEACLIDN